MRVALLARTLPGLAAALAATVLAAAACGGEGGTGAATATLAPSPIATVEAGIASPVVHVVPDFELPAAGGGTVRLSDVYERSNTVLVFYRGYF